MWRCTHDLSIEEVLRDPIVRAQMDADRVPAAHLETLLRSVAARLDSEGRSRCWPRSAGVPTPSPHCNS